MRTLKKPTSNYTAARSQTISPTLVRVALTSQWARTPRPMMPLAPRTVALHASRAHLPANSWSRAASTKSFGDRVPGPGTTLPFFDFGRARPIDLDDRDPVVADPMGPGERRDLSSCRTTTYYVTMRGSALPRPDDLASPYSSIPEALRQSAARRDCRARIIVIGSIREDAMGRAAEISRPTEIIGRMAPLRMGERQTIPSMRDPILNLDGHELRIESLFIGPPRGIRLPAEQLLLQNGGRVTIRNVSLQNPGGRGIVVRGRAHTVVEQTQVHWCALEGILIDGLGAGAWFGARDIVLSNNNQARLFPAASLAIRNRVAAIITGCRVEDTPSDPDVLGYGIWLDGASAFAENVFSARNGVQIGARDAALYLTNARLEDGFAGLYLWRVAPLILRRVSISRYDIAVAVEDAATLEAYVGQVGGDVILDGSGTPIESRAGLPTPDPGV